jgi:predicted nucleic acid-binding protein
MRALVVDTDVVSYLFKQDSRSGFYEQYVNDDSVPAISFMTLAELEQWAILRNLGQERQNRLARFISNRFIVADSNEALCKMWAQVRGVSHRAGRPIGVGDAWIAATALLYGAELVTHNANHFNFLPGLQIITEEGAGK